MKRKFSLFFIFLPFISFSQRNFYKEAQKLFDKEEYFAAIDLYKCADCIPRSKRPHVLFNIGYCYMEIYDYKQAEIYFQKAIRARCEEIVQAYLYLADCKKWLGKYNEVDSVMKLCRNEIPNADPGHSFEKSCEQAKKWLEKPTRYVVKNVSALNTRDWETSITYADTTYRKLYLCSSRNYYAQGIRRDVRTADGQGEEIIFQSQITDTGWSTPVWTNWNIQDSHNDYALSYCIRNEKIYLSQEFPFGRRKKRHYKYKLVCFSPDIKKKKNVYSFSFCLPNYNFITPFTVSGKEIIFSSDMPGGFGGYDLWKVTYSDLKNEWSIPQNLGSDINSEANEKFPFIHADGTLYFSSDRVTSIGGYDNFVCWKDSVGQWGKPENLRSPLNSSQDDLGIIFEKDFERGYFVSNRTGGVGGFDIYSFVLPPNRMIFNGIVKDINSRLPIFNAKIFVRYSGDEWSDIPTDEGAPTDKDGKFYLDLGLKQRMDCIMYIVAEGYSTKEYPIPIQKSITNLEIFLKKK